ncbi:MAG TPA: hypothetical protein VNW47_00575 [Terriglobales bacterium]|nr:hypothetical protein [Terriglobales bacterium]
MAKVSTVKQIGIAARVVSRIVSRHVGNSRTAGAVMNGLRTASKSLGRVAHQLWLEVTGFTFFALAVIGGIAGFREYAKYQAGLAAGPGRVILAACFTVTFAWFGLSSFWRVRKKN